jgi:hypothetical protein
VTSEDPQQGISVSFHSTRKGLSIYSPVPPIVVHPETANVIRVSIGWYGDVAR